MKASFIRPVLCLLFVLAVGLIQVVYLWDGRLICDHDGFYLSGFAEKQAKNEAVEGNEIPLIRKPYPGINILLDILTDLGLLKPNAFRLLPGLFFLVFLGGGFTFGKRMGDANLGLLLAFLLFTLPPMDNAVRKYFLQDFPDYFLIWGFISSLDLISGRAFWRSLVVLMLLAATATLIHPIAVIQFFPLFVAPLLFSSSIQNDQSTGLGRKKWLLPVSFLCSLLVLLPTMNFLVGGLPDTAKVIPAFTLNSPYFSSVHNVGDYFRNSIDVYGIKYFIILCLGLVLAIRQTIATLTGSIRKLLLFCMFFYLISDLSLSASGVYLTGRSALFWLLPVFILTENYFFFTEKEHPSLTFRFIGIFILLVFLTIGALAKNDDLHVLPDDDEGLELRDLAHYLDRRIVVPQRQPGIEIWKRIGQQTQVDNIPFTEHSLLFKENGEAHSGIIPGTPPSCAELMLIARLNSRHLIKQQGLRPEKALFEVYYFILASKPTRADYRHFGAFYKQLLTDNETESALPYVIYHPGLVHQLFPHQSFLGVIVRKRKIPQLPFPGEDIGEIREKGLALSQSENLQEAEKRLSHILAFNPADHEVRIALAEVLARQGQLTGAVSHWEELFSGHYDISIAFAALKSLACLESEGVLPEEYFSRFLPNLEKQAAGDRKNTYLIRSIKVYERKLKRDWPGAWRALSAVHEAADEEQIPGIRIEEALVLLELDRFSQAASLLEINIKELPKNDPLLSESALHLATIMAYSGDLRRAEESIALAKKELADPNMIAHAVMAITSVTADPEEAKRLLRETAADVDGDPRALLLIELGKRLQAEKRTEDARSVFQQALETAKDETLRNWLSEMISE